MERAFWHRRRMTTGWRRVVVVLVAGLATNSSASADIDAAPAPCAAPLEGLECAPLEVLSDRLATAVTRSPRLALQRSVGEEAGFRIDEVRSTRRPRISLAVEQRNSVSDVQRNAFDRGSRMDGVLRVRQLLFDFGASGASLDSAERTAAAERWATREATRSTVLEALDAHYDLLRHRVQRTLARANVGEHEALLDAVSQRAEGGVGGGAEVLRARGRLAEARAREVSLTGGLARAENRYRERFFEEAPQAPLLPDLPAAASTEDALEDIVDRHPGFVAALERADAAVASLKAARRERLPRMTLELQGRQLDVDQADTADRSVAVLVNLEYVPYSGGQQSARVGQANERLRQARMERAAIRRELESAYRSARTDVTAARAAWAAHSATVDAERAAIAGYRDQFAIGRRSLTDVLEAQRDLFQSELLLVDARIEWDLARFRLLAMESRLLADLGLAGLARDLSRGGAS